jgi:hypothetical protein
MEAVEPATAEEFAEWYSGSHVEFIHRRVIWQRPPDHDFFDYEGRERCKHPLFFKKFHFEDWDETESRVKRYLKLGLPAVVALDFSVPVARAYFPDGEVKVFNEDDVIELRSPPPAHPATVKDLY